MLPKVTTFTDSNGVMRTLTRLPLIIVSFAVLCVCSAPVSGQDTGATAPSAWTRKDALESLQLHSRDPYLQFVLMQLSKTPAEAAEARRYLPASVSRRQQWAQRNQQIDLFSIFSGSLAIQESLQLDAMTGTDTDHDADRTVAVASLTGPSVQSHPWAELLAARTPRVSELAQCVPDDHLYIRFQSVSKLMKMREQFGQAYFYVVGNMKGNFRSAGVMERLQRQWMIDTNDLLMPLYDAAVSELAITSSDLFFREGTDATLIMRLNQPKLIRSQLDLMLVSAAKNDPDATIEEGSFNGIPFQHVSTPDRALHVYAAYPTDDLHVRSNSKIAFERILETISGKSTGTNERKSLAQADEFRYIRTLMPIGAEEEDGFIYLSDPFIRNLIGAEKKLTQRERLICRSRLQMLDHAQLLFRTQFGRDAQSIDELSEHGCLGTSDKPLRLTCPQHGEYAIDSPGIHSLCSVHGSKEAMIPCCENPVERVSDKQAAEYKQFVLNYSRYWQTFFDPIAVRIQLQPKKTRVETIVLPLINNSIYMGLAAGLGGRPEMLDSLPVPEQNIFSLAFKLDKDRLLEQMGIPDPQPQPEELKEEPQPKFLAAEVERSMMMLGLALHNHHSAFKQLPPRENNGRKSGLSWRVHVLPFMEEQALYEQFRLDEPWDSEHNRKLIPQMPDVFAVASPELAAEGKTRFVFPQHPDAMYRGPEQTTKFRDVLDGLSNTVMMVVADEDQAVTWTKPDDLPIDMENPRQGWSEGVNDVVSVLLADGGVHRLPAEFPDDVVGHLLTRPVRKGSRSNCLPPRFPSVPAEVFRSSLGKSCSRSSTWLSFCTMESATRLAFTSATVIHWSD